MLQLVIKDQELYDESSNTFINTKGRTIQVEHSLVSVSKWESKWNKPFLTKEKKSIEETIDYVKCMTLTQNVPDKVYENITNENIEVISKYIAEPMTATWFNDTKEKPSDEVVTSEIIYYSMIAYNIPFECQKWHLSRLLTLIKVCKNKNEPPKKMTTAEIMNRNRELNNKRRRELNSKG